MERWIRNLHPRLVKATEGECSLGDSVPSSRRQLDFVGQRVWNEGLVLVRLAEAGIASADRHDDPDWAVPESLDLHNLSLARFGST